MTLETIRSDFAFLDDWEDRYRYEIEAVLEARTAAALDADPEHVVFWVIGDDLRDSLGRALGDGDRCGHDMSLRYEPYSGPYPESLLHMAAGRAI